MSIKPRFVGLALIAGFVLTSGRALAGSPDHIKFSDSYDNHQIALTVGHASDDLFVSLRDTADNLVAALSTVTIAFNIPGISVEVSTDGVTYLPLANGTEIQIIPGHSQSDPFRLKFASSGYFIIQAMTAQLTNGTAPCSFMVSSSSGMPDRILLKGTNGSYYQSVVADSPSAPLRVYIKDSSDEAAPLSAATNLFFMAQSTAGSFVPELSIGTEPFRAVAGPVPIAAGLSESEPILFRSTMTGNVNVQVEARDFPTTGQSRYSYYSFDVLPSGSGFSNVGARTTSQDSTVRSSTVTITPDNDGVDEGAVFSAVPPAGLMYWELWISTEPSFETGVLQRVYSSGTGDFYWHAHDQEGRLVPSGTYYARFQSYGQGIVSSTMAVTVQSAGITGSVVDHLKVPLSDAEVNVYGSNGGGYRLTDENGKFTVSGLKPQTLYNVELRKTGYQTVRFSTTTGPSGQPPVDVGATTLEDGVSLAVHVDVSQAPPRDIFGGVSAYDPVQGDGQWGSLRVASGSVSSDNGRYSGDPQYSTWTYVTVRPSTSYNVEINLPDYGRQVISTTSLASGTLYLNFSMVRKPNVYGTVAFPSPLTNGQWVSVDARTIQNGVPSQMSVAWGGVWVEPGATGGIYALYGLNAGDYQLRAYARGYVSFVTTVTVLSTDMGDPANGGVDFGVFSTGGRVTGTITVSGNSMSLPQTGPEGACQDGTQFAVPVNAYNRTTFMGASGQACLSKSTFSSVGVFQITGLADGTYDIYSYLPGFEFASNGPLQATVTGGVGGAAISLMELTGRVNINADIPSGDDPALVHYELSREYSNSSSWSGDLAPTGNPATATGTISGLGTGLYTMVVENANPGRGLRRESIVPVKNGSTVTAAVDLTVPSHSVSGELVIQNTLVLPSTWSVSVSSVPGLAAAGVTPLVDVYALPFPDHFEMSYSPLRTVVADMHTTSATYRVPGLTTGGYFVRVRQDLVPPTSNCSGCDSDPGLPDLANEGLTLYVDNADLDAQNLVLTNGVTVSGAITRPSGDTTTDSRTIVLRLRRSDNYTVWQTTVVSAGASTFYGFSHVAPGDYVMEVTDKGVDARYGVKAFGVKVAEADVTKNISLLSGGVIVGRLRDADSETLINAQNYSQFLPQNFNVSAQANPWVQGGYVEAARSTGTYTLYFDEDGRFRIPRLVPGTTYDLRCRGYESLDDASRAQGIKTYAPSVIAGISVEDGQTVDVGVVDLRQGTELSGLVVDVSSQPLANVRVVARPSVKSNVDTWNLQVETFTDEDGHFTLQGIDRSYRYYDIIAAPRFRPGEKYGQLTGPRYAEERRRMVNVTVATATVNNNFALSLANGTVTGQVLTIDSGILQPVFTDGGSAEGLRGADIVLHREGAVIEDNPMGEIEERTEPDGTFRVEGLNPGVYTLRALALGYVTSQQTIIVPAGATKDVGTITLGQGATVSGTLTKPGGLPVTESDVNMVVGVDENFEDFILGSLDIDPSTLEVGGYSVSGFKTDKIYSLIIVTAKDDIMATGSTVTFTQAGETQVVNLEYRPASPRVFVNQTQRVSGGSRVTSMRFFISQALRNLTSSDGDLSALVTVSSGTGVLSDLTLNSSRDTITADYTAPESEPSFTLNLNFYTVDKDPSTNDNFKVDEDFSFYAGFAKRRSSAVSNVVGGECQLEDEATGVSFPSGTFDVASSSSVEVEIRVLDELPTAGASMARQGPRWSSAAYPTKQLFSAVSAAATLDPFSSFYDIFLPAGVNSVLKNSAQLTLTYDADRTVDPNTLNIYFYHPEKQLFLLENASRIVDTVNHTITVSVGHLSTFLVLDNQAPVVDGGSTADGGYAGNAVQVFNVPNPFGERTKQVTFAHSTPGTATTEGTFVCYNLPAGKSGEVVVDIFDATGGLVRTLRATAATGASFNRLEWDGRNDEGRTVASGVYLGRFTLNGGDEKMFKLAVVK